MKDGETPLMVSRSDAAIAFLLECGSDPDEVNKV